MNTDPNQIPNAAAASPSFTTAAARKGWFSRNWKWLVPALLIVFIVLPLALIGSVFAAMKNSDVVKESLLRAQANPLVVQKLGTPIQEGWLVSGSINVSGSSGDADLAVPISGPKGKGNIYVTAHKGAGAWDYQVMEAAIEGSNQRINLLSGLEVTPGAEFPTPPGPPPQVTPTVETRPAPPATQPADPPASAPTAAAPAAEQAGVLQTQETTYPGVVAELTECRRKEGVLNIKMRFRNTSDKQVLLTIFRKNAEKHYVTAKNKKYFILKDSEGEYVAEDFADWLPAGGSHTWWAKYPAPPADIKKITLITPLTTPFEDVPITDQ
jgi:hypothetical protein